MFFVATVISITYLVIKFMEMRFIEKENKPIKYLIRDSLLVYISAVLSYFILQQLNPIINTTSEHTPVFTDNPGF